ncbi:MAG TPA: phage tail tube protein [Ramlibacter sp.]|nr:phage tail tube protein [Ramlibacter sp.]
MSKKMRKMAILAKLEVTYALDPVPTGAANALVVSDVEITPLDGEAVERNNIQPHFGNNGSIQATSFARIKFNIELAGSGAAGTAPGWSPVLRACAVSATVAAGVSVTYAPISEALESVTIYGNVDGVNHVMPGVRGEAKLALDAKGKPVIQCEFMGLWAPLTDTALPVPVYTGWTKPVAVNKANTTASLHGEVIAMQHFDLAFANQLVKRDLTGVDTVEITDRKSAGSIVFENTAIATKDWVSAAKAMTLGDLEIVHGTVAGNIIEINAAATCEISKPTYSNSDGVQMMNLQTRFIPTADGNDEWSIVVR